MVTLTRAILSLCAVLCTVYTLSCHQCSTVSMRDLTKEEMLEANLREKCVDTLSLSECTRQQALGYCDTHPSEMWRKCRVTCDMCSYTQAGTKQAEDTRYWERSALNVTFQEAFIWQPVPFTQIAQSTTYEQIGSHLSHGASLAQDGDVNTYSQTQWEYDPWLMVKIEPVYVHQVIIINRWNRSTTHREDIRRLDRSSVSLVDDREGNVTNCGAIAVREGYTLQDQTYSINCSGEMANRVRLNGPTGIASFLHIAEIQVLAYDGGQCGRTLVKECVSNDTMADTCSKLEYRGEWRGKEITLTKRGCSTIFNTDQCVTDSDDERLEGLHVNFAYNSCVPYYCDGTNCNPAQRNVPTLLIMVYICILGCDWLLDVM